MKFFENKIRLLQQALNECSKKSSQAKTMKNSALGLSGNNVNVALS